MQNLAAIIAPSPKHQLEDTLRRAGIDPADVRVDEHGLTGEHRRILDAAYVALGGSMLADRRLEASELCLATKAIAELTGHRIGEAEIVDGLLLANPAAVDMKRLTKEYRFALLEMAFKVTFVDNHLNPLELAFLRRLTERLDLPREAFDRLVQRSDHSASAQAPRNEPTNELDRALACLGVAATAGVMEIRAAYRQQMLRYHPDRAGTDQRNQAVAHAKAQEINWAYDYLLHHVGAR